jgi:hypothetical protein
MALGPDMRENVPECRLKGFDSGVLDSVVTHWRSLQADYADGIHPGLTFPVR